MSRRRKELFIQIKHELYDTKVWREMHWYSKLAYLRFKRKYSPGKEEFSLSYREMKDEMTMPTFAKAIKELERSGFIGIKRRGGLYREKNLYRLSEEWRLKGVSPLVDIHMLNAV